MSSASAAAMVRSGTGRLTFDDGEVASVAIAGLELTTTAVVRYESESAEVVDFSVALRE